MERIDEMVDLINVKATLLSLIDDPYGIRSVVMAVAEENQDLPIWYPPSNDENPFAELVWISEGQTQLDIFLHSKDPDELLPFIKLPEEKQQRVLYRAYYIQLRFFFCKGRFWKPVYKGG